MRCLITLQDSVGPYSQDGLKMIHRNLKKLEDLPYSSEELRSEAASKAEKISIQGVQPKLSARLNISQGRMDVVEKRGTYILKPQSSEYPELPENEDLTMRLANSCGIQVPLHFLMRGRDGQITYVIKRYDRFGRNEKVSVEDFAQLSGQSRDTKYNSSMEKVAKTIETFCTYPMVEKSRLFLIVLFSFLTGNEDMHLKNFSVLSHKNKTVLTPAYDLLNTTIAIPNPSEELALPLNSKKRKLTRKDLVDYYGEKVLQLNRKTVDKLLLQVFHAAKGWDPLIRNSFLSAKKQNEYISLLDSRKSVLYPES